MSTYKCELINKGVVRERFYRQGSSIEDVLSGLNLFKWGKGSWEIEEL